MSRHRTLDEIEARADDPAGRANAVTAHRRRLRPYAEGTGPDDLPLGSYNCWCGQAMGHDWPGKAGGTSHPRERNRNR